MTIFPELVNTFINQSIIKKSQDLINYRIVNIRDFADSPHFKVDDTPFGGGDGMIFKPEPIWLHICRTSPSARSRTSSTSII